MAARRRALQGLAISAGLVGAGTVAIRRRLAEVDPQLRSPIAALPLHLRGPVSVAVARRLSRPTRTRRGVRVARRSVERSDGTPVELLVFEPEARRGSSGALLWVHGGGYLVGIPEQNNELCSHLASELGILVVAVRYRLAPEHPFPAGLDDVMAGLNWVFDQADPLAIDTRAVAVGGESAGGGLAAAAAQRARDEGLPPLCHQLLLAPMLDDRTVLRCERDGLDALLWSARSNRFAWSCYLGSDDRRSAPPSYAAPARTTDLTALAPAWIGVGDIDLFVAEDRSYAKRLAAARVPCELVVVPGMYHGADGLARRSAPMRELRRSAIAALGRALGSAGAAPSGTG